MRTTGRTLQLVTAVLVIVVGLTVASVRVLFPNADRYREDLEDWLAAVAGQPVAIGSLQAEWRGLGAEFRVTDLQLRESSQIGKDGGVNARFESATVSVDVIGSLLSGKLRPQRISIGEVSMRLGQATDAGGSAAGLEQHALAVLEWLLAQRQLELHARRIEFTDLSGADGPLALTHVELSVRNQGASHALDAAAQIPGMEKAALAAHARIDGDPATPSWSGDIAVAVADLNMATLGAWRDAPAAKGVTGHVSVTLESRWYRGALVEADGNLNVRDLRVTGPTGSLGPVSGASLLEVTRGSDGWRTRLLPARSTILSFRDPSPLASIVYATAPAGGGARVSVAIPDLPVHTAMPLLPLAIDAPEAIWRQVFAAQPRGRLRDVGLDVVVDAGGLHDLAVAGTFEDAQMAAAGGLPALSAVDGAFDHGPGGTRVRFTDGRLQASLPTLFPQPLAGEKLRGELRLSGDDGERRLAMRDLGLVTPDVTARANGELVWQGDDAVPFMDLSVAFSDGNLERLEYFVPTPIFGEGPGAWLDQAFPRGHLTTGTVELRGRAPEVLGTDADFSFTVHASVRDTSVHYLDGWPIAEGVAGTVHIADWRLVSDISEGYFFGARMRPSRWMIRDILAEVPAFEWQVKIDGTTEDAVRYVRESPLRERFRSLVNNVHASGLARLDLDVVVPLVRDEPRVSGILEISGNTLEVPSLRQGFTDIAGRIRFGADGLSSEDLTATYLGREVTAAIDSVDDTVDHTRARMAGTADAAYLARHLHNAGLLARPDRESMPILARLGGETAWQASIDVIDQTEDEAEPVVLRVESALEGATMTFPAPFTKDADTPLPVTVEARFDNTGHRRMRLRLGAWASGIFDLVTDDGGYRLERGAVHLGRGKARLPDENILMVSGRMPRSDLGEWSALMLDPRESADPRTRLPTRIDLTIERLAMLGAAFDDVRLSANATPLGDWRASVSGPALEGVLSVPADRSRQAVVADFERLAWTPVDGARTDTADPRDLPPLRFTCVRCSYGDMRFEDVEFAASRTADGLSIDSLYLRTDGFDARASGAWTSDAGRRQRTRLDVHLSSDDLGRLLASLGHKGGKTRGGITDVTLAASWDGPPSDFDLEHLDGVMHFRAGEGTLTEVGQGTAGRLFALLVLPDLPRRLKGDFSDLFEEGFAYKHIEGTFNIERGHAYTNDLTLDGSLARIDIAGRTGLVDEDYDQLITVTPKLSGSLPLVPIWLVEKAFRKEIFDTLFAYQYTITGSWDEPSVTRIVVERDAPGDRS